MPSSIAAGPLVNLVNIGRKLTFRKDAVIVFEGSTTEPANPVEGMLWYDKSAKLLKLYNGTAWVSL